MKLQARAERWPLREAFVIARGSRWEAEVVVVECGDEGLVGRGEGVPYGRYHETTASVLELLSKSGGDLSRVPRGSARAALDAALLDLEAQRRGVPVHRALQLPKPAPVPIARTLSVDEPARMAERARAFPGALLKVKLCGDELDLARLAAIRRAAPSARLWADANEGWDVATYDALSPRLAELGVAYLEQPLPASADAALEGRPRPVPLVADESAQGAASLRALRTRYDLVNVKLDKCGGLRETRAAIAAARGLGLGVALGCMVSSSLAIAPALHLASLADLVDLDGSLFLAQDREGGARLDEEGNLIPPSDELWGFPRA